jgi:hypothetical protein
VFGGLAAACAVATAAPLPVPTTAVEWATDSRSADVLGRAAHSYQAWYAPNQFPGGTGAVRLTGLRLRLSFDDSWKPVGYAASSWPDRDLVFPDFRVTLGRPTDLLADGEYPSSNGQFCDFMADSVLARSGPLTIAAHSYDGGGDEYHPYGATIAFATPYDLDPAAGLIVQINHAGYGPLGPAAPLLATTEYVNNEFDAIDAPGTSDAADFTRFSAPLFMEFDTVQLVPEPAGLTVLAIGLALCARRR